MWTAQSFLSGSRPHSSDSPFMLASGRTATAAATAAAAAAAAAAAIKLAAAVASTDIIEQLIQHGSTAAEFSELDGWTAFHCAAAAGRERVLLLLLDMCPEEAAAAAAGSSLLHLLAECCGGSKATEAALKAAALRQQVDAKAKRQGLEGWTPLHIACLRGKLRMARHLLQAGADSSVMTGVFHASSPLLEAAATGAVCGMLRLETSKPSEQSQSKAQPELLQQLQEQLQKQPQADSLIPVCGRDSGLLPIHLSCFGAHRSLTRLLLHVGSRIDALTQELRWSPLHFAVTSGSAKLVGDICRWNLPHFTIHEKLLHASSQDLETVKVLLDCGANPLKTVRFAGLRTVCLGCEDEDAEEQEDLVTALHIAVLGGATGNLHLKFSTCLKVCSLLLFVCVLNLLVLGFKLGTVKKRRAICAAIIGFAAAEAPAEIAAEACGLERLLADADESLAIRVVEELSHICLHQPERHRAPPEGKAQNPHMHEASEAHLRDLFSVIASRVLQQAVLRNFTGVVSLVLQLAVYERKAAEKALRVAASLGYARICQLLVDAGIEAVSPPCKEKGPFELLAKALQQQQKHSLLQQQHDILATAAAAASAAHLVPGTSGIAKRAAATTLEAAAAATLKHTDQLRRETAHSSNSRLSASARDRKTSSPLQPPPIVCSLQGEEALRRGKGETIVLKPFKLTPKQQTLNPKD
ncbi:hypothetical protein, conserved [Eimeria praecox]|uniref:Uncharacterized protein n=1 Tax=Eimeria praecox TaxID=51316 RepID=U6GEJ7_9EIME|nr:hypothetical protein, conserved [Eimeria praecox]